MNSRIKQSNGVANEIEQICIETELAPIRLRYVKLLTNACLDSKLKFGCALWNITKYKNTTEKLNIEATPITIRMDQHVKKANLLTRNNRCYYIPVIVALLNKLSVCAAI